METDTILQGDNMEVMRGMAAKSIPLVVADPPYNIGKAAWDKIPDYLNWCGAWIKAVERIMADNGSLYIFHNDMPVIAKLMAWIEDNTALVFKQMIVWNKRFDGMSNKGFLDGYVVTNSLRSYQVMAEYILFYTFQDDTGLSQVYDDRDCFEGIKGYLRGERKAVGRAGYSDQDLRRICEVSLKGGGLLSHFWGDAQWMIPTADMYAKLQTTGFFQKPYEELRMEYEELRYAFNNQKTHHSVWNYEIAKNQAHPTQKPVDLLGNIIRHSSNEGDVVCDPFAGVGSTAIAAIKNNRRYLCVEKEAKYVDITNERIRIEQSQLKLDLGGAG